MKLGWLRIEGQGLAEAGRLVDTLAELLDEERAAVTRLDAEAIAHLARRKQELVDALRTLPTSSDQAGAPAEDLRALRARVEKVVAEAQANAALLADAVDAVVEGLGLGRGGGTYDRRARVRHVSRPWAARRA